MHDESASEVHEIVVNNAGGEFAAIVHSFREEISSTVAYLYSVLVNRSNMARVERHKREH